MVNVANVAVASGIWPGSKYDRQHCIWIRYYSTRDVIRHRSIVVRVPRIVNINVTVASSANVAPSDRAIEIVAIENVPGFVDVRKDLIDIAVTSGN